MTAKTNANPITDDLRTLKRRVALGFIYLQTQRANPVLFERGRTRLTGLVVHEYLPALDAMLAAFGREALSNRLAHVEQRLGKGATLLGKAQGKRVDDAYIELVNEYEILFDALQVGQHPDTFLVRFFDRVDDIQHRPAAVAR